MEAEIKYLNVTEKHFLNHLNFLQSMNQIETNKPASLYFMTESEDDGKFHSYIILAVYNNLIQASTCLKTPFLVSSTYTRDIDKEAWLAYHKWISENTSFFQNLLNGLEDAGFNELKVLEPAYHSMMNIIYDLKLKTKQQKDLQKDQIQLIYRY
ncbi:hypothetical protein [Lactobacillus crispatus]|uniref:Uncharacterized protein n=1 Tax=Lactobacillus crispatus FB077-07 TaxID=883092 RepID=K1MIM5_9LACO|nr:hypothetical protein [Lactobacillus crispatus]EKB62308.1 hypothetical protein HMPREF9249_02322 [Lactobacillus crispatus FB077-07]